MSFTNRNAPVVACLYLFWTGVLMLLLVGLVQSLAAEWGGRKARDKLGSHDC